jgi:hypothetical protein
MTLRRTTGLMLAITLLVFLLPFAATAGSTTHFKGKTVNAAFFSVDESGCIATDVYVFASAVRSTSTKPKSGDEYSAADIYISRYDFCTDTSLESASGSAFVDGSALQVSNKLTSATLTTSIEVFDYVSGDAFTVEIDLDWAATGQCSQQNSKYTFTSPGFKIMERFNGTFCAAVAAGTIVSGATNYAAEPSSYADIVSARSGSLTVSK